jgi:hypothetical protein
MALSANPTAWWKLDEASGGRVDATGNGHSLTSNNSVGATTGKIGSAAAFVAASSQYLSGADATDIRISGDLTLCCWANYTNNGAQQTLVHKGLNTNPANYEYLWFIDTANMVRFRVSNGSSLFTALSSASLGASSGWVFLAVRYNSSSKQLLVRVNQTNGSAATLTGTPNAGTRSLFVGCVGDLSSFLNSPMDMLGIFQAYLSDADLNTIYNSGAALDYPYTTAVRRRTLGPRVGSRGS